MLPAIGGWLHLVMAVEEEVRERPMGDVVARAAVWLADVEDGDDNRGHIRKHGQSHSLIAARWMLAW
ncbi:hypothetical protein [Catellatospora sp. NPDC049609]|uniref:hypothetical protein n=1 Tax=Catellatospora sp. NPDC049609 TaxID=3155505 RepID=UPI0034409105